MNDHDLMGIHADTNFTYDARGRMLRTNEPRVAERRPAPRLFFGRTGAGDVVRFGATLPDTLVQRLQPMIEHQPAAPDLEIPPTLGAALGQALTQHAPNAHVEGGPVYRFPASITPRRGVVRLTRTNRALVHDTFPWLEHELADWQPCFVVVHNGAAVSVCFSSRVGARAVAAGVETLPDHRGRGYATAVTAAWGAAIRASGRIPLYSTTRENLASQGVARRAGLLIFGVDMTWA